MITASGVKPLELSVTNFGPIAGASIELRPMSVFVGPSNTGKSYWAVLIYALHRFFGLYAGNAGFRRFVSGQFLSGLNPMALTQEMDLSENDIARFYAWAKESFPGSETAGYHGPLQSELPESVAALVRMAIGRAEHLNAVLDGEIIRCFGVDKTENLIRYPVGDHTGFSLRGNTENEPGYNCFWEYKVAVTERGTNIDPSIPTAIPLRIEQDVGFPWLLLDDPVQPENVGKEFLTRIFLNSITSGFISDIVGPLARPAHCLPADRAGVMHAHQVAVRGLIASASRVALRPDSPMPVLSGVLGDFLEQLVALATAPHFESPATVMPWRRN